MKNLVAVLSSAVLCASGAAFAAGGTISGTVSFSGTPPAMEKLKRTADPYCAKTEATDESVVVHGGKVQNVVVRINTAVPGAKAPTGPVVMDQQACMYRPRVQAAFEGQPVEISNHDGTLHNVHSYAGAKTLFNQAQPPNAAPISKPVPADKLSGSGDVLTLKCDVHPWMKGYVVFSKSPYFAVSKEDGTFTLKDVPPGTYTLEAWHEKLGTQTAQVKVEAGRTASVKFSFSDKK